MKIENVRRLLLGLVCLVLPASAQASILELEGLSTISFWERTGSLNEHRVWANTAMDKIDRRLLQKIAVPTDGNADIYTDANEAYDYYISDAEGNLDPNGSYLTIDARYYKTGGFNISGVELNFADGRTIGADHVTRYFGFGKGFIESTVGLAVDDTLYTHTYLGTLSGAPADARLSITVGFNSLFGNDPTDGGNGGGGAEVPEPASMLLLGSGLVGILARRKNAQ